MQSTGQMSAQASHSMQSFGTKTVCTSQFRQRSASLRAVSRLNPSSTSVEMSFSATSGSRIGTLKRRSIETSLS